MSEYLLTGIITVLLLPVLGLVAAHILAHFLHTENEI